MYVIFTTRVNWHRENLQSGRENTGNLQMQFEWGPCIGQLRSDQVIERGLGEWSSYCSNHAKVNTIYSSVCGE